MKKQTKIFSLVVAGLMALTFIVTPLTVPRIPPLEMRAAEEAPHYLA